MDNDIGEININDDIWTSCSEIAFVNKICSGLRFRYSSEIEKKSYSMLKSETNSSPILQVVTNGDDPYVTFELVTENETELHFNMLYEVVKDKSPVFYDDWVYTIKLKSTGTDEIKLDNLGIRKMKQKEAIVKLQKLYPHWTETDAKKYFNAHKDVVRLRAILYEYDLPAAEVISGPIKSQTMKDNKDIRIRHIAPKTIAGSNEQIIVVLEKKITTSEVEAFIIWDNGESVSLVQVYKDQQTFIFAAPISVKCENPTQSKFLMRCGDNEDSKPILFLPVVIENRKRKIQKEILSELPLKRSTITKNDNYYGVAIQQPLPESGLVALIQTDGMHMETDEVVQEYNNLEFDNESHGDSGIHSGDRSSDRNSVDEGMSSSGEDSDSDSIETEGIRQKLVHQSQHMGIITIPPKNRATDSRLDTNNWSAATKKILSEVARIGHDFAFGRTETELFGRVEQQLPVVFTLQDDVGDTPLNNAILKGNVEHAYKILNIVRQHCHWALDLVNTSGHSALILAPACDVPGKFVEKLLEAGCRVDLWDDTGKSAVIYAIDYKNVEALKVLLRHVSMQGNQLKTVLSRYVKGYNSPLQLAIMNDFEEGVRMLLELKNPRGEYMVDVNEVGLMNDETALHISINHQSSTNIVKLLLSRPDIDLNKLSTRRSALRMANEKQLLEIVSILKLANALDLPCPEEDNIEDSDDDSNEETNEGTQETVAESVTVPELEMVNPVRIETITSAMKNMSLKGEQKKRIIALLMAPPGPNLDVDNLKEIVKPSFRALFNKYDNPNEHSDISDYLGRFDCLPNSIGQLFENLDKIGRVDVKLKIWNSLSRLHN